ncbi:MAG: WD40 repeat domain-containing protein [Armatimonadota bacterium]|nr:WD40 repeat domain-containing protein [Armatimonadota bacterium]
MSVPRFIRNRWTKIILLVGLPIILYLVIAERLSWRPRTIRQGSRVYALAFSPDGKILASAGLDNAVRLWDVCTRTLLRTLKGRKEVTVQGVSYPHPAPVYAVDFSPDGNSIASAGSDGTKLWDVQTGKLLRALDGEYAVAFSTDGKVLTTFLLGDVQGGAPPVTYSVMAWDVQTGKLLRLTKVLVPGSRISRKAAISPDGSSIIISGNTFKLIKRGIRGIITEACLFDARTGKLKTRLGQSNSGDVVAAFSADSKMAATGQEEGTLQLWSMPGGKPLRQLQNANMVVQLSARAWSSTSVDAVAFSPDGRLLAAGSNTNQTVRLWNMQTGQLMRTLEATGKLRSLVFSPDGATLATGSDDGTIKLWRIK